MKVSGEIEIVDKMMQNNPEPQKKKSRIKTFKLNLGALVFIDVIFFQSWVKIDFFHSFFRVLLHGDKKTGVEVGLNEKKSLEKCWLNVRRQKKRQTQFPRCKVKAQRVRKETALFYTSRISWSRNEGSAKNANTIQVKVIKLMIFPLLSLALPCSADI